MVTKKGKLFIGVDPAVGPDVGVLVEGVFVSGKYRIEKRHILRSPENCEHDYAATDDIFDYCIHCGDKRLITKG